jgi:hypothetical protein
VAIVGTRRDARAGTAAARDGVGTYVGVSRRSELDLDELGILKDAERRDGEHWVRTHMPPDPSAAMRNAPCNAPHATHLQRTPTTARSRGDRELPVVERHVSEDEAGRDRATMTTEKHPART